MDSSLTAGKSYSSFTLVDIRECPDYNGTGYLFRHDRTGFEVYFFSTDDEECFFSYNVFTPPSDNTGVFHILEHTVLTGSKKYPVRDPFMGMDRNSVNTFLNAMTGPDRTYYPAASPVKKDFDNIFSVYTDAVFDPLLRRESFMQEGIRLTRDGFDGVVFSEMKGDVSNHSSVVFNTANRYLFPEGSPYTYESGGDPGSIPDLTYEKFIETYRKYYVPANMTLFLYGSLDILEKLEFLEREYLSSREAGERAPRPSQPAAWTEERRVKASSDAEDGEDGASITLSWLLGDASEPFPGTIWSLIVGVLLGNPGCPLYRAIIDSGVGRDISSEGGMNDSFSALTFSTGFAGADEKDADRAEKVILEALERICDEGIDRTLIEATLRRMEFTLREIKESTPKGYRMFFNRIDRGWAYGRNPSDMLSPTKEIDYIRRKLSREDKFLENYIRHNLLENPHRLLSVVVMDEDNAGKNERIIEEKFREQTSLFDEEEERRYLDFEDSEDSPEALQTLPRLSFDDIPSYLRTIERKEIDGILVSPGYTAGIVYADIAFECSDFTDEELEYASVLTRMLTMTNVGELDYSEFLTLLRSSTGAFSSLLETGTTCSDRERDFVLVRFKSLEDHYGESLDLVRRLLGDGDFSSPERVTAVLRDIQSDFESSFVRQAHLFALSAASQYYSGALYSAEKTQGLSFWFRVVELLKGNIPALGEKLAETAGKLFVKERVTFHLVTEEGKEEKFASLSGAFVSSLPAGAKGEDVIRDPGKTENTAFTFSTPVSYVSLAFPSPLPGDRDTGALRMFLSIISRSALWALEREKGGAYGSGASLDISEDICYFYTYRDPRLDESVSDFRLSVESEVFTPDKLEDGKLRVLSKEVRPTGPQSRGITDLRRYLYGITDEIRASLRTALLETTLDDLERARKRCLELMDGNSAVSVLSSSGAAKKSGLKFRARKLPFSTRG